MAQQLRASPQDKEAVNYVERVSHITLTGAPSLLVLDTGAIWTDGGDTQAARILRKLDLLARHTHLRVLVRGVDDRHAAALQNALPNDLLVLGRMSGPADLPGLLDEQQVSASDCIAILAEPGALVPRGCTAFFVGQGEAPEHTHATRQLGPQATDLILALYGTALAQERAGAGFRAVSEGGDIPTHAPFKAGTLEGVVRSTERPSGAPRPAPRAVLPDAPGLHALAGRLYGRLVRNLLPDGAVVASPAHGKEPGQPNYWFYWQRDGSAAMGHLIDWHQRPPLGLDTSNLALPIERYVQFVEQTQRQGHLGTTRYTTDGKRIPGFGNPQLDGPPLSALTLARLDDPTRAWEPLHRYLDFLLTPDGRAPSMDAWEFIYGRLFIADFVKRRALLVGAEIATRLGHKEPAARYTAEARRIETALTDFIDPDSGRIAAYRETHDPWFETISRLDIAVVSALLHARHRRHAGATANSLESRDAAELGRDLDSLAYPASLATVSAIEEVYESLFAVNRSWSAAGNTGYGIGRFPEDANNGLGTTGGNPWPLATVWIAQFYYHLAREIAAVVKTTGSSLLLDDPRQISFFQRAAGDVVEPGRQIEVKTWGERVLPALVARGDGYLNFVVHHIPEDGAVTEQIDRETGEPRGAHDLTWALSEVIATIALYDQVHPVM